MCVHVCEQKGQNKTDEEKKEKERCCWGSVERLQHHLSLAVGRSHLILSVDVLGGVVGVRGRKGQRESKGKRANLHSVVLVKESPWLVLGVC